MANRIRFRGGSTRTLREETQERLKYKNLVDFPGMIDTLYDKFSYGFLNHNYEVVYLAEDASVFSNFPEVAEDVRCLGFVADAFDAFRNDYLARINNTDRGFPPYLEAVVPELGYQSFEESYANYTTYVSIKYSNVLKNDKSINDYSCYLDALKKLFIDQLAPFPVTRSGFILSRHNNVRSSGLVLEMAKLDYNRDLEKGEILQSKDFQCFLDYAISHGFLVDKFAPWRLYANLEHPTIKAFLRRDSGRGQNINLTNRQVDDILNSIYRVRSHKDDLYDLQDFVVKIYNDIIKEVEFYTRSVYNPSSSEIQTENVFREELRFLSTEQWLEMLLFVRMLEIGVYTPARLDRYKSTVLQNYSIYGLNQAIEKIGNLMSGHIKEIYERSRENNTNT